MENKAVKKRMVVPASITSAVVSADCNNLSMVLESLASEMFESAHLKPVRASMMSARLHSLLEAASLILARIGSFGGCTRMEFTVNINFE